MAVGGICDDLAEGGAPAPAHELVVKAHSSYYYTEEKLFIVGTLPVVRVRATVPLKYSHGGWDLGWLVVKTSGAVHYRRCDPYTLAFDDREMRLPVRWFVG